MTTIRGDHRHTAAARHINQVLSETHHTGEHALTHASGVKDEEINTNDKLCIFI